MKKLFIPILFLLFLSLALFISFRLLRQKTMLISGEFEGMDYELSTLPTVTGKVIRICKREGDWIEKGDTILLLDTTVYFLELKTVEEKTEALKNKIEALDRLIDKFEKDLFRVKSMEEFIPVTELEKLEVELESKKSEKRALSRELESLYYQKEKLKFYLQECYLISPTKGILDEIFVKEGEVVKPGFPLVRLIQLDTLDFITYIPQTYLTILKIGDSVKIYLDVAKNRYCVGEVYWISSEPEFTPRNLQLPDERVRVVYQVKIRIPNIGGELKPGMTGVIDFGGYKGQKSN